MLKTSIPLKKYILGNLSPNMLSPHLNLQKNRDSHNKKIKQLDKLSIVCDKKEELKSAIHVSKGSTTILNKRFGNYRSNRCNAFRNERTTEKAY